MEELRNYELENEVEVEETEVGVDAEESTGSGLLGKIVGGVLVTAVVAGVTVVVKNKDKIKKKRYEKMAKKLIKAGYDVYEGPDYADEEVVADEESTEETTE